MSDAEWRERLTDEQYRVTRQGETERPFTGRYWDTTTEGTYHCICCDAVLFESDTKFDAGCGWPSFNAEAEKGAVATRKDTSHGMVREEILCAQCQAHLGHVFDDGPAPTGLRYCVNSASLQLKEAEATETPR